MATNIAQKVLMPAKAGVFRTVFLYTGQGESTLMIIPTGDKVSDYMFALVDSDKDNEKNEIDLVRLLKDLFKDKIVKFNFINTHPHNDHIGGIQEIYDEVGIAEVWHSNHKPGGKHNDKYEGLRYVIGKVGKKNEFHLKGTNSVDQLRDVDNNKVKKKLGVISYQVLSPADFLCDDINEGDGDERDRRIHEQCGVIKFTYGTNPKSILVTGDSDKNTWKDHIMYHEDNLESTVLSSSHHGSDTFFRMTDDDDIYEDHIEAIKPQAVIVSAPKQKDSRHGHPHDKAMELYCKHAGDKNVYHLGEKPYSVIVDIDRDGEFNLYTDEELIREYGNGNGSDGSDNKEDTGRQSRKFTERAAASEVVRQRFA